MNVVTVNAKTQYGITDTIIGAGCACDVYKTQDPDIVFKLYYNTDLDYGDVQQIWEQHRLFAEKGLAPQLYGEIIEYDAAGFSIDIKHYGFFVEYVYSPNNLPPKEYLILLAELKDKIKKYCVEFNSEAGELNHNWGITKQGEPVLIDFCVTTSRLIGILK